MHPILLKIGSLHFPSYFTLACAAFVFGTLMAARSARIQDQNPVDYIDSAMAIAVGIFIGAKLFHVLFGMPKYYFENPLEIFKVWQGGFVFYGGFIFGTLAGFIFAKRRGIHFGRGCDIVAPPLALAMAVGRLACFCAGCCYGRPTTLDWPISIVFNVVDGVVPQASPLGVPLVATQTMSSLLHLLLFCILVWYRPRKRFSGELALLYVLLYSIGRFIIEIFRNDPQRGLYFGNLFSTSQAVSVGCFVFALTLWLKGRGKVHAPSHS